MILEALVRYYETQAKKGRISRPGWGKAKVSYALNINASGNLIGVINLKTPQPHGKKTVFTPQVFELPEPTSRTAGVAAQFLWDKASYMLGIDVPGKEDRAKKCFEACAKIHLDILQDSNNIFAKAICAFFKKWDTSIAKKNEFLLPYLDDIVKTANICFTMDGKYPQDEKVIVEAWNKLKKDNLDNAKEGICLVTGEKATIARLHPMIKGVRNAQSSGAALVSFNASAYESYGHDGQQGLNAPISQYATFAYTTALNNMLSDEKHSCVLGDMTVVFWSETADEAYADAFNALAFGNNEELLMELFAKITKGEAIDCDDADLNLQSKFYILGISPNAARLSIRLYLEDSFGSIINNIKKHYERMKIVKPDWVKFEYVPVWALLQETANKNARDKAASPLLAGNVLKAIISDTRYPVMLLQNTILRIRAEQDNSEKNIFKISRTKAAIIKAFLLKSCQNMEEVATMAVNEECKNVAYVLGRLFSVLEEVQENANPGINSTIKDRYFNSACATPAVVFPILIKLANSHLRKLKGNKGLAITLEKKMSELENCIEMKDAPVPAHLTLKEQGIFILGYYHQNQARYTKKEEK